MPNAVAALLLHAFAPPEEGGRDRWSLDGLSRVWSGYTFLLSLLLVFWLSQAYMSFRKRADCIAQAHGEWLNTVSSLFACCNQSEDFGQRVLEFQRTLVHVASLLHCSALQQVRELKNCRFEVVELDSLSKDSLQFLQASHDRCEIVAQWVRRLALDAYAQGTLTSAPPLLGPPLNGLAAGLLQLKGVRKIEEILFPRRYTQLIHCMLVLHWVATPLVAKEGMPSALLAAVAAFWATFVLWYLAFTNTELDQPLGEDPSTLELHEMQRNFNRSLVALIHPLAQQIPVCKSMERAASVQLVDRSFGESPVQGRGEPVVWPRESDAARVHTMAATCFEADPSLSRRSFRASSEVPRPRRQTWQRFARLFAGGGQGGSRGAGRGGAAEAALAMTAREDLLISVDEEEGAELWRQSSVRSTSTTGSGGTSSDGETGGQGLEAGTMATLFVHALSDGRRRQEAVAPERSSQQALVRMKVARDPEEQCFAGYVQNLVSQET